MKFKHGRLGSGCYALAFGKIGVQLFYPAIHIRRTEFGIWINTVFRVGKSRAWDDKSPWEIGFRILGFGFGIGADYLPERG